MISKKEKTLLNYIYKRYQTTGNRVVMNSDALRDARGLDANDIGYITLNHHSEYLANIGAQTQITEKGIAYMEQRHNRVINLGILVITTIAAIIAAIYSVLSYYK